MYNNRLIFVYYKPFAIKYYWWEPPEKVIKVPFKANYFLNSTMMALFLQGIVSKKNKQTEKNMSFIAVYHKFT